MPPDAVVYDFNPNTLVAIICVSVTIMVVLILWALINVKPDERPPHDRRKRGPNDFPPLFPPV